MAQRVKCLPETQEIRVQSLGQEDPLEKEVAARSNTLAWKIPWTEEPGRLQSMGCPRQEYWSGLPLPSPWDLSDPGMKPASPTLAGGSLPLSHQGSPELIILYCINER